MVRTIEEIQEIIQLRKSVDKLADTRFLKLLEKDERLLKNKELFEFMARAQFGPTFGTYLAGYVFGDHYDLIIKS